MIFLVLVGIIALIVMALNMYDTSNKDEIKNYLENKNCEKILYSKGVFKGICKDEIIKIPNSFSVDIQKDKFNFKFNKIVDIEEKKSKIIINNIFELDFKEKKKQEEFYKRLEEKINK